MSSHYQTKHIGKYLPYLPLSLALACVPDVPYHGDEAADGGLALPAATATGAQSSTSGAIDPNGDPDEGRSQAGDDNPSDDGPGEAAGDSSTEGGGMNAMSDPALVEPFQCETDADCAVGLVCEAEACIFVPPERVPSAVVQTAAGGLMRGSGMRMQLRVGAPPPIGQMGGNGHRLTLGPLAGH